MLKPTALLADPTRSLLTSRSNRAAVFRLGLAVWNQEITHRHILINGSVWPRRKTGSSLVLIEAYVTDVPVRLLSLGALFRASEQGQEQGQKDFGRYAHLSLLGSGN